MHEGIVLRQFDFDSQLLRMSTIATSNRGDQLSIYTKGSPESMKNIFDSNTVPSNYEETLKKYTSRGFRVLALGSRLISKKELTLSREKLEHKLNFDGF